MLGIYLISCQCNWELAIIFISQMRKQDLSNLLRSHSLELAEVGFEPSSVWPQSLLHLTFLYLFNSLQFITVTIQHDIG